jgi:hypothetical protein
MAAAAPLSGGDPETKIVLQRMDHLLRPSIPPLDPTPPIDTTPPTAGFSPTSAGEHHLRRELDELRNQLGELFGFARAQAAQPQSAATNLPPQPPHPASAAAPDPRSQTCRDCRATIGAVASILTGEALAWCTLLARLVMTPPRGSQQAPGPLSPRHCLLQEGRLPHAPPTCHNAHSSALTQRTPECAKTRIFACAKTRTVIALRGFPVHRLRPLRGCQVL